VLRPVSFVLIALFVAVLPAAAQSVGDSFAAGSEAFAEGDYLRALSQFEDARDAGSRGPAVHYNIGVCQYRLGLYDEAAQTFDALAHDYPAMRELALYNLGLVRLKQNRGGEARELFARVREDSDDERLAGLAAAALRATPQPVVPVTEQRWIGLVDLNIGYDDNVALIDEASVPATQSVDSAFTELFGFLSGPRRAPPGLRFDGSAYLVSYNDASQFDQAAFRAAGLYEWALTRWRLEAGPALSYSTLDGSGFEQGISIGIRARRMLSSELRLTLRAAHDVIDNGSARFSYIAGSRDQLGIAVDRFRGSSRLSFGYDFEANDRDAPGVSPTRNQLWLLFRYAPSPDWSAEGRIAWRNSSYDDLATPRDENRVDLTAGFTWRLAADWELAGRYRWSDNDSNVDELSYSRNRLSVGLTRSF